MNNLFNFGKGKIMFFDFNFDINSPLNEQINNLKEDLIQVSYYDGEYILDIGWYPSFDINGFFKLIFIKNGDWENPILNYKTKDVSDIKKKIEEIVTKNNF